MFGANQFGAPMFGASATGVATFIMGLLRAATRGIAGFNRTTKREL